MTDLPTAATAEDMIAEAALTGWSFFDGLSPERRGADQRATAGPGDRMAQIAAALWQHSP